MKENETITDWTWKVFLTEKQNELLPDGNWVKIDLIIQREIHKAILEKIEAKLKEYDNTNR